MGKTYDHTITGLLRKRTETMALVKDLRDRMGALSNDIEAIERILHTLGYDGELKGMTPRGNRVVFFHRNELRRFLLDALKKADGPLGSRELAEMIVDLEAKDRNDRRLMYDMVKRVGKSLRLLQTQGLARSYRDKLGHLVWELKR